MEAAIVAFGMLVCFPKSSDTLEQLHRHRGIVPKENRSLIYEKLTNKLDLYTVELTHESDVWKLKNRQGLVYLGKIFDDEALYLFGFDETRIPARFSQSISRTEVDAGVFQGKWIRQQFFERQQRVLQLESAWLSNLPFHPRYTANFAGAEGGSIETALFNDPLYEEQWYLHRSEQFSGRRPQPADVNVLPVWEAGITGSGIRISVLDDGVCRRNPEVAQNYDQEISYDYIHFQRADEGRNEIPENSHGTCCAAIAAGAANNKYCGIGVAFGAKVGGVRVLDDLVSDAQEAMALTNALGMVDIYTASWGPKDDGRHVGGPGILARKAFKKGVTKGRGGRGAVYVWAAGNGGGNYDNCNLDGYASNPYTLTFAALTADGLSTFYSEPCSAVLASTFVGGLHRPPSEENWAAYRKMIKVIVPDGPGKCRENFQGTSAAAPIASGVVALLLDANPSLTWRDVQHIIVETSRVASPLEPDWSLNAAGHHFHPKLGFGALDAAAAVRLALERRTVGDLVIRSAKARFRRRYIKPSRTTAIILRYHELCVTQIETVVVRLNIQHPACGTLQIYLSSPSNTSSQLLSRRPLDNVTTAFHRWDFVSLHFWGENPTGKWTLRIMDGRPPAGAKGLVDHIKLTFFGTSSDARTSAYTARTPVQNLNRKQLMKIMERERLISKSALAKTVVNLQ